MNPRLKLNLFLLLIILSSALLFYFNSIFQMQTITSLEEVNSRQISSPYNLNFLQKNLSISFPHTVFFSPDLLEIEPPFAAEDFVSLPLGFSITYATPNYILINNRYIFDTFDTPYTFFWESADAEILKMLETADSLLLVLENSEDSLFPKLVLKDSASTIIFPELESSFFVDAAFCKTTGNLSILVLSDDGLFPSSRVLRFDPSGRLLGATTLENSLYYKIFTFEDSFVLVGLDNIVCYNITGNEKWRFRIPDALSHTEIKLGNTQMLYFYNTPLSFPNTLEISQDGEHKVRSLPRALSSLQVFNEGFIGVSANREIVSFRKDGEVTSKIDLGKSVEHLYWNNYNPKFLYLTDYDGRLFVYSLVPPAKEKEIP